MVQTLPSPLIRWLPNAISILRILLVPFGLWLAEMGYISLLALTLVGLGVSDLIDGWIARRFSVTSPVGATLDAVADKLAQVAFVSYFTFRDVPALNELPLWYFIIVLARDAALAIGYLTLRARHGSVDTEHRAHGKISSVVLFFVILSIVLQLPLLVTLVACAISAILIVVSTALYLEEGTLNL